MRNSAPFGLTHKAVTDNPVNGHANLVIKAVEWNGMSIAVFRTCNKISAIHDALDRSVPQSMNKKAPTA